MWWSSFKAFPLTLPIKKKGPPAHSSIQRLNVSKYELLRDPPSWSNFINDNIFKG